jgi:hypothetical protein
VSLLVVAVVHYFQFLTCRFHLYDRSRHRPIELFRSERGNQPHRFHFRQFVAEKMNFFAKTAANLNLPR